MHCGACGSESIGTLVEPGCGPVRTCNDCGHEVHEEADDQRHVEALAPKAARRPQPKPAAKQGAAEPTNPLPALRARRRWVVAEIKRLRKLEDELASIDRILSAAGKPVAVLHAVKRAHG